MKRLGCYKVQSKQPLTAPTDFRASEGGESTPAFEVTLNVDCIDPKDRPRMGGWTKLLDSTPFCYQNQDLHDQLLGCQFYHTASPYSRDAYTAVTDYEYPYFFPGQNFPSQNLQTLNEFHAGSVYPELWNDGTYGNSDGYFNHGLFEYTTGFNLYTMCDLVIGWPDNVLQLTVDQVQELEDDMFLYQNPNYYLYDYFYGCYVDQTEPYSTESYSYGDQVEVITSFPEYNYTLCSEELYYQPACREPITLLQEVSTNNGVRKLVAATKSRIYVNDARGGNWRIVVDRLGGHYDSDNCSCHPTRFKMAQVGNILLFTNNIDAVLAWNINDGPQGCFFWSADYVIDLLSLEIEAARAIGSWNGFAFIGNVVVDGERLESRIYWSDFNDARSWAPGQESVAGYHDFGRGEHIIEIAPIGGRVRVYTDKAIYDGTLVGGDQVFHFREIYRGPDTIAFPNSLVNTGDAHFYLGEDTIWRTEEHGGPPVRVEWMHLATGAIFEGLGAERLGDFNELSAFGPVNRSDCEQVVGGYDSERKTLWYSWPTDTNDCPNMSMIMNLRYGTSSLVDHGFTAFANYEPDMRQSIRDWVAENGICNAEDLLVDKEGVPCDQGFTLDPPAYLFNETEDPDSEAHSDSVHNRLCNMFIEDICREECGDQRFIFASAEDYCIKEFNQDVYYREQMIDYGWSYDCGEHVPGLYSQDGYTSMIQDRLTTYGVEDEKMATELKVSYSADDQTIPGVLSAQLAYSAQPSCRAWTNERSHTIACQTSRTNSQHSAAGSRQSDSPKYQFYSAGVYLGWRFYVTGTGSPVTFNGLHIKVRRKQGKW